MNANDDECKLCYGRKLIPLFVFCRVIDSVFSVGRYFSVFTIPIPKENSVGTFRYKKGAVPPFFLKRGAMAPFLRSSTPFWKKGGRKGGKYTKKGGIDTDRNRKSSKSDTRKIPIPKKLLVTPRYTTLVFWQLLHCVGDDNLPANFMHIGINI